MGLLPMKQRFAFPLLTAALIALAGCYTNPVTGRSYAVLTSLDQERQLGAQSFTEIKSKEKVSNDPAANARVTRVGRRIAQAVGDQLPGAKWEFVVFDSKDLNAFALPGGKVGVYTGLLRLAESDDELAIVMGHEIGHAVARHGGKRMTEAMGMTALGLVGATIADQKYGAKERDLFMLAYGGVSTVGFVLPHSRNDESEADLMGLQYAAKAGYDPRAAIGFWQKMSAAEKGPRPPAWLSTHPTDAQRIAAIKAEVPRFIPLYESNKDRPDSSPVIGQEIGR
jgi:predicted Zn-dependent protease